MSTFYKPSVENKFAFTASSEDNRLNNENENYLVQIIENFFRSINEKNYNLMVTSIKTMKKVFKHSTPGIYEIISPFQLIDGLLNTAQIPQVALISLKCISFLITVKPEVYQEQLLQKIDFVNYLFETLKNINSADIYECASIITNLIDHFQSNSEYLISNLDFNVLHEFSLKKRKNSLICLKLMGNIVQLKDINHSIIEDFIYITNDIKNKYIQNAEIRCAIMDFLNKMIKNYFLSVTVLIDLELIDSIFNFISEDDILLISCAINFYLTVIDQGFKDQNYLKISKQIMTEASITEIIDWSKQLSTENHQIGFTLLYLLIKYQEIFEINMIDLIDESGIVGYAIYNIRTCGYIQKLKLLYFIQIYIEKSADINVTTKANSEMFFSFFDDFLHRGFDNKEIMTILDMLLHYLYKFQICRTKDQYKNDLGIIMNKFDICESLNQIIFNEDYRNDDVIVGKINVILNYFKLVSAKDK